MARRRDEDERAVPPTAGRAQGADASTSRGSQARSSGSPSQTSSQVEPGLPTPTLPKGGGAIRGIGEKFTMAAATGTASVSVPLAVSPGRAGLQPALSLSYSSGGGNGPFGLGWSLDVPAITRKTDKKLPEYHDGRDSDVFILSGTEDLVRELAETPAGSGNWVPKVIPGTSTDPKIERFRPRTEGLFARIERRTDSAGNVYWVSIDRNNVTSIYGRSSTARIVDPADPSRIFSWLLEATYDDRGNVIVYDYKTEDLDNVPSAVYEQPRRDGAGVGAQKYLKTVRYGNTTPVVGTDLTIDDLTTNIDFCFTLVFDYGEYHATAPTLAEAQTWPCRQDPFSTYKARFEIRTYRLCQRVLMFHSFSELGGTDLEGKAIPVLVRSTEFTYDESPNVTYLKSVTQKGFIKNGSSYDDTAMPPVEFAYEKPQLSSTIRELDAASRSVLPPVIDGRSHQWVDLDGEGIPGLLSEERGAWRYHRNLGGGRFGGPRVLPRTPSLAALSSSRQQLMSVAGDGQLELVEFGGPAPGYFTRKPDEDSWADFVPFKSIPVVDWNDPNLQFIDLNGDGFGDILITQGTSLLWYPSKGKDGFAAPISLPLSYDENKGPAVVFADGEQSIQLADMSGDGLTDIVRIRNGNVCYWPNLGFGRFGAKVTMSNAPRFDRADQFDPARIRLFDVDGSGTTDLLYLGGDGIRLWSNLAGNAWGEAQIVTRSLPTHSAATISVVDLLGTGTGCLTWFTTLTSEGAPRLRYIDLRESKKPHLLVKQTNGMGLERLVTYAPSTKFYLEDRAAGVKWATRLPFPVQVVERVEVRDYLAGTRLVSTYRYRHGYFDGHEREFRGFGLVEQWDAETVKSDAGSGTFSDGVFPAVDGEFVLPPVHTKTWFHTGAWKEQAELTAIFRGEYYDPGEDGHKAAELPDTAYSGTTLASTDEEREAARALKGMILRQEVYADDGTTLAARPYTVSERCYEVRRIQPKTKDAPHAVFFPHPREELTYQYERNPSDPRVLHALTLEVDAFGTVRKAATIAYPRRTPATVASDEQGALLVTVAETEVVHKAGEDTWYRVGVPISTTSYQLHGLAAPSTAGDVLSFSTVKSAVDDATVIPYDASPGSGHKLRVLSKQRVTYYKNDLSAEIAFGSLEPIESLALVHHQEQLALTGGLVTGVYNPPPLTTVTSTMLTTEGGYIEDSNGDYWAPSPRPIYDAAKFYLPTGLVEPFGNQSSVTYDDYGLLVEKAESSTTTAALNNVIEVENDYRVLQPSQLTDPNGNQTELAYDALGMVVKTALMGKVSAGEGDTLSDPTTMFEYDLCAYKNGLAESPPVIRPAFARMRAREQHGGTPTWQDTYVYTDGSGRELLTKVQAAPAAGTSTARWVGTGRTVFDNKGNPIKKYEPYFSTTSDYESEASIVETGVTPILRYDPLGRLVRTDFPDGTFSKVVFDTWREEAWDQNDTVLDSRWYDDHTATGASAEDLRAAGLAAAHASTPTVTHYDTLGRAVKVVQDKGGGTTYTTTTTLDIQGNPLAVVDARTITTLSQAFDLLKRSIRTTSKEAGESRVLPDINGLPIRSWNSRDFVMRTTFDALRRPTHVYSKQGTATETLVLRTIYGEELGSSTSLASNLRGRAYRSYDSAGAETNVSFDFKGNLLQMQRRLAVSYTTTPDWSAIASLTTISAIESAAASMLETEVFTTSSTYDALNRVVTSTTPDTSVATPTYNEANQLTAMQANVRGATPATSFVSNVYYNARGQRTKIVYANGTRTEYTYDAKTFRLITLLTTRTSDSAKLQDVRYHYDPVGNIVETKDLAQQTVYFSNTVVSPDSKYEYDPLYRLVKAEGREHPAHSGAKTSDSEYSTDPDALPHPNDLQVLRRYTEEYEYDSVGNVRELVHSTTGTAPNGWTRRYQYSTTSNKLVATGESSDTPVTYVTSPTYAEVYSHDARGNMTSMPHLTAMDWDFADRLQHCNLGGGGNSYFTYDAAGQRVRKVWVKTSSLIEERIYVGGYEVWRKRLSGTLDEERQTLHVMDDQRRVAMVETKTVNGGSSVSSPTSYQRFQLDDQLGSSRVEVDASGALLTYEEYHPYGTTAFRASSGASGFAPKRYRYTGKERDEETGLYYYGARYYPPWLARWTACDSSRADGLNRYTYVRCNPTTFNDPDGRKAEDIEVKTRHGTLQIFGFEVTQEQLHGAGNALLSKPEQPEQVFEVKDWATTKFMTQGTSHAWKFKADNTGYDFPDITTEWKAGKTKKETDENKKKAAEENERKKEAAAKEYRIGVVQNVSGLEYKATYADGQIVQYPIPKGPLLDRGNYNGGLLPMPWHDPSASLNLPDASTIPTFDNPGASFLKQIPAASGKGTTKLTTVTLKGDFTFWWVIKDTKTDKIEPLYYVTVRVDLTFTWDAKKEAWVATGGTTVIAQGSGPGPTKPVVTGPPVQDYLKKIPAPLPPVQPGKKP